jgi:hypothetical protein
MDKVDGLVGAMVLPDDDVSPTLPFRLLPSAFLPFHFPSLRGPQSHKATNHSAEKTMADEAEGDPLAHLAAMGFRGGEAVDALMQCGGDVMAAVTFLTEQQPQGKPAGGNGNKVHHHVSVIGGTKEDRRQEGRIDGQDEQDSAIKENRAG